MSNRRRIGAAATGAGGGTIATLLVQTMDETNPLKKTLLLAVPTLSIFISLGALICVHQLKIFWIYCRTNWNEHSAKSLTTRALADGNASPEHKAEVRKKYEEFERRNIERVMKRVEQLDQQRINLDSASPYEVGEG